jgi:hypothetical protein
MATTTIFGSRTPTSARRPSTSNGSPTSRSESVSSYTNSKISSFSRKSSFSTAKSPKKRNNSTAIYLPSERRTNSSSTKYTDNYPLPPIRSVSQDELQPRSADSYVQVVDSAEAAQSPPSPTDSFTSTTPYANMLVRPGTGYQSITSNGPPAFAMQPPSPTLETITYQHIQETSSKRISTLDYLRKASVLGQFFNCTLYITDSSADTKDVFIGSIHYCSTSRIYNECPISILAS